MLTRPICHVCLLAGQVLRLSFPPPPRPAPERVVFFLPVTSQEIGQEVSGPQSSVSLRLFSFFVFLHWVAFGSVPPSLTYLHIREEAVEAGGGGRLSGHQSQLGLLCPWWEVWRSCPVSKSAKSRPLQRGRDVGAVVGWGGRWVGIKLP